MTAILFAAGLTTGRACDICGCFTPQLNTMSKTESSAFPWWKEDGRAVSQRFPRFVHLPEGWKKNTKSDRQFQNSSITRLVSGYQITSRFALQLNVPLISGSLKDRRD